MLPVQHGVRELGHNVRTGYFSQNRIDVLNASHTVLDSARDMPNPVSEQTARTVLGSFLFRGDDVFKTVAVLSGGEKSRLALVRLLLDPPNLLLMDEPTTHLDVGSIDALIGALKQYHGTLIFISHDVHFIRAIATSVLHITARCEPRGWPTDVLSRRLRLLSGQIKSHVGADRLDRGPRCVRGQRFVAASKLPDPQRTIAVAKESKPAPVQENKRRRSVWKRNRVMRLPKRGAKKKSGCTNSRRKSRRWKDNRKN